MVESLHFIFAASKLVENLQYFITSSASFASHPDFLLGVYLRRLGAVAVLLDVVNATASVDAMAVVPGMANCPFKGCWGEDDAEKHAARSDL